MSINCQHIKENGSRCRNSGVHNGFCGIHDPAQRMNRQQSKELEILKEELEAQKEYASELENQIEDLSSEGLERIKKIVLDIKDLETLRIAEKVVLNGLIDGTIDPKAGGACSQLLKHQEVLIKDLKPGDNDWSIKDRMQMNIYVENLSINDAWTLAMKGEDELNKMRRSLEKEDVVLVEEVKPDAN